MSHALPSFLLGYHGCDHSLSEDVLAGKKRLKPSNNKYDWLGPGVYFWENNPERALEYAAFLASDQGASRKNNIRKPAVIGAIIDPGYCLNLLDSRSLRVVQDAYEQFSAVMAAAREELPRNRRPDESGNPLLRNLDCAVIQWAHQMRAIEGERAFDTVRGVFVEGKPLYPESGFNQKSHIQVAVRNMDCILGYFRVIDTT